MMERRSTGRRVRRGALLVLFLAAAWAGWFVVHRVAATPAPEWDGVRRINELVAARQPEGVNAWPIYERIMSDGLGIGDAHSPAGNEAYNEFSLFRSFRDPLIGEWDDPVWAEQRQRIERLRPLLEQIGALAEAPGCAMPYKPAPNAAGGPSPVIMMQFPDLVVIQGLSRLNASGLRAAAELEDWDEVVHRFRVGQAMARHLTFQVTRIECLASATMVELVHTELIHTVIERELPEHVCMQLLATLETFPWPAVPHARMMDGERLMLEDFVQWVYTPGENGFFVDWATRYLMAGDFSTLVKLDTGDTNLRLRMMNLNPAHFTTPNRTETMRAIDRVFTIIERGVLPDAPDQVIDHTLITRTVRGHSMLELLAPSLELPINKLRTAMTLQAALEIMLRLELHHAQTGAWPKTLAEAMTPAQTLDTVTGNPIEYERVEDDEDGRPYILLAPDEYTHPVRMPHWPELNPARPPISDAMREAWEAEQEVGGASDR